MRETHLQYVISEDVTVKLYVYLSYLKKANIPAPPVIILLTLAPFIKFTLLGPLATDGHGLWIVVACLVGVQQLHAS